MCMAHYDAMTVGEALGISLEEAAVDGGQRTPRAEHGLQLRRHPLHSRREGTPLLKPSALPAAESHLRRGTRERTRTRMDWDTVFLSNHDNPRVVNRPSATPRRSLPRTPSAKLLETMLLTLRGTPFLYQGDELGMTNYPFRTIHDFDDIEVKNAYKANVLTGKIPEDVFIENLRHTSRDNSRTPMQWDSSANGGFTTAAKPWLAANPNYKEINAASETAHPDSIYAYTAAAIAMRHAHPAFVYGDFRDLDPENKQIFCYIRTLGSEQYLVVLNFGAAPVTYALPGQIVPGKLMLANMAVTEENPGPLRLRGWEARVYRTH